MWYYSAGVDTGGCDGVWHEEGRQGRKEGRAKVSRPFTVVMVAAVCHEANRALCARLGDHSQPAWADAPLWQTQSAINGVEFHIANPDATPEGSHENWLAEKERDGWRYGPVKDAEAKTHPCYRPHSELPADQQAKDHLFRSVVHALAPFLTDGDERGSEAALTALTKQAQELGMGY